MNMDETIWNTTSEIYLHFFLGGITILFYTYAIFICFAIYDYQDEKPHDEKWILDHQIKDWMTSQFCYLFFVGLVQLISLFAPAAPLNISYFICYIGIFLLHFHVSTIFVYLYLQYIYTFQPQDFVNVQNSTLRKKCLIWRFLLTLIILLLSILCPLEKQQIPFQLLSKGQKYDR